MDMDKEKETNLPSQRFRTLSGRRTGPTVPGAGMSSSSVGPARSPPTGKELKVATVEDTKLEEDLPVTALTEDLSGDGPEKEEVAMGEEPSQLTRSKRKAQVSPGAHSLSEEEREEAPLEQREKRVVRVTLRKMKDRVKKACLKTKASVDLTRDSSLDETMDEMGSVSGIEKEKGYRTRGKREETMEVDYPVGIMESEGHSTEQKESEEEDHELIAKSTGGRGVPVGVHLESLVVKKVRQPRRRR